MRARPGRPISALVLTLGALTAISVASGPTSSLGPAAAPTTTAAANTSTTRPGPTTTAVTTTTEAGPAPRNSSRVAAPVDIEKIRPTNLPLRTLAIATAAAIAVLAIAGLIYGKVRSRVPTVAAPRLATVPDTSAPNPDPTPAGTPSTAIAPPTPLPPPSVNPLPPPEATSDWAPPTPTVEDPS